MLEHYSGLGSLRGRPFVILFGLLLLTTLSFSLWTFGDIWDTSYNVDSQIDTKVLPQKELPSTSSPQDIFELEGPFDGFAIQNQCSSIEWQEGLYFDCSNNSGGIGNMRSFILNCIRYAIDAGASIIMPTIRKRNAAHLEDLFTTYVPMGYMFDEVHFVRAMAEFCPQMNIIANRTAMPNGESQFFKENVNARAMANHLDNTASGFDANRWVGTWREDFDWWMQNSWGHKPSRELPVVISWEWALFFSWPIWLDGPRFANTFGRLLRIRPDAVRLASVIVDKLEALDLKDSANHVTINPMLANYVGVHLRVESDCLPWWPREEEQIDSYLSRLEEQEMHGRNVYIATGSQSGFEHFQQNATTVLHSRSVSKEMLLEGTDLDELQALQWDQQGLVDYLVLLKSQHFLGMTQSSFSQNVASRRHLLNDGVDTLIWRGYKDSYSFLHGLRRSYNGIATSILL